MGGSLLGSWEDLEARMWQAAVGLVVVPATAARKFKVYIKNDVIRVLYRPRL